MIELSKERIDQILHEETAKTEDLKTILRAIYFRYMRLYEKYFEDIDALDDDKIVQLRKYHEETIRLVKYYLMDIPQDISELIEKFENVYTENLLGDEWHEYLFGRFEEFKEQNRNIREEHLKTEFTKQTLSAFYEAMGYIFREGFGTDSKTAESIINGIKGLLFGKEK